MLRDSKQSNSSAGAYDPSRKCVRSLVSEHDWSKSPLGARSVWPPSLRTTFELMLDSPRAMCLAWGPQLNFLYNDGYVPILGLRHPWALGRPMREVWADVWDDIESLVQRAGAGESIQFEDFHLLMERNGYPEDTWWSFSYSPARDDSGAVAGMYCVTTETTQKVIAERGHAAESERLRRMVDQAPGFMALLTGPELRFEFANAAFQRLTGRHDFVGKTVREALPDLQGQAVFERLDKVYASGKRFLASSLSVRLQGADASEPEEFILDFLYEPVIDERGAVTGIFIEGYDVTETFRAQEALRGSEARLRLALQAGQIGEWELDVVNDTSVRALRHDHIFGYDEAVEGWGLEKFFTHVVPEDRDRVKAAFITAAKVGTGWHFECRIRRAGDGAIRWIAAHSEPQLDSHGRPRHLYGLVQDITEQREAEAALRELNATLERRVAERTSERNLFSTIVETTDAFIQVADLDYRFLAVNRASADEFERIYGVRPSVGDNMLELLADQPEHQAAVRAVWSRAFAGEEFTVTEEFGDPDRMRPYYEVKFNTLRDAQGERIGAYQFSHDVTDRLRDQAKLRVNEARLRTLFQTSYQLQGLLAPDGTLLDANATSLAAIKLERKDVLGRPLWETPWFTDTPGMPGFVREGVAAAARGEIVRQEVSLNVSSGTRSYDFSLRPIRDAKDKVFWIVLEAMDTTDRRVAEEALRQSQKMEAMGQLTGGVAHDFNNLLTPIIGGLDTLLRRGLGNERERRMIDGALQSADRAKMLVQRLLAFARRQPLQLVAVDLRALIDSMAGLIGSTLGPNIDVRVELAANLPPANADPNQLEMAILNLSVNARDAMPEGGTLTISAARESVRSGHRSGIKPGHYVRLSVADTGIGMDAATRARAIEPFFSTKGVGKGTGLGLSMVHGLAAQLGGGLTITSAPDRGTTVELWLPLSLGPIVDDDSIRNPTSRAGSRGRALLVDDEELVRLSTADMLLDLGYEVVEAGSAEEALWLVRSGTQIDLLVTDHLMPGMNGAELAAELRTSMPELPVLIVSGYAELDGIAPGLPRLTKPFRNSELAESLDALMQADRSG